MNARFRHAEAGVVAFATPEFQPIDPPRGPRARGWDARGHGVTLGLTGVTTCGDRSRIRQLARRSARFRGFMGNYTIP